MSDSEENKDIQVPYKGNMGVFLKWWIFNVVVLVGCGFANFFNLFTDLWHKDVTKLSFLILVMYVVMSLWCGLKTFRLSKIVSHEEVDQHDLQEIADNEEIGWFVSDLMTSIGMIGTVIGFIVMLGSFHTIDTSNIKSIQEMFNSLGTGMSIALLTTLVGLICSSLLKIQYFNLGHTIEVNTVAEEE
jgi:hypothetical protein